jgi:hypothetical protein
VHTQSSHQCLPFLPSCDKYASFIVAEQAWAQFFPSQAYSPYFYDYLEMVAP